MASGDDLERGQRLGKWIIIDLIGAGGMGRVYSARNSVLDREVALKTIDPAVVAKASGIPELEILERFRREAQAVAKVKHPNVLELYSYEEIDGRPIIEMELLHGETLGRLLRKGPLTVERAIEIILPICAGVTACHDEGIVHRDLKPQNISIEYHHKRKEEVVKVLDFGVSKFAIAADLTQDGRLLGTPTYMAPEQTRGRAADARSDQYAMGVLLYHCITGRAPYQRQKGGDILAVLAAVQEGDFPRPREIQPAIPEQLEQIVIRAMSRSPDDRFPCVAALAQALNPFAPPEVRDRWRRYFADALAAQTGPDKGASNSTLRTGSTQDNPRAVQDGGSGQNVRTLSEGEIVTAADSRSASTTAFDAPDPGRAAVAADEHSVRSSPVQVATPWALSEARLNPARGGRRRVVRVAVGAVLAVAAVAFWARPPRVDTGPPPSEASRSAQSSSAGARPGPSDAGPTFADPAPGAALAVSVPTEQTAGGQVLGTDRPETALAESPSGNERTMTTRVSPVPKRRRLAARKDAVEILKDGTPNLLP